MPVVPVDVDPHHPLHEQPTIGLIGMGAMGTMYAKHLSDAGWKKISVCDIPEKYESLKHTYKDVPGITVHRDGHAVSRISDFIMYSVEAEFIERVVQQYGPSTKVGAIVSGQTSVKAPEKAAFEKFLPEDVHIVSIHSLHGPTVSPVGQPFVIIQHRAPDESVKVVENIFKCFKSRYVHLTYEDHDLVTANVQAVTHAAFLTMGTAWAAQRSYPWEQGQYVGGIETVKVNIMLRIYANKWHVYAGLAILNPSARIQIDTFASSATDLFKLMLAGDYATLRQRVYASRENVFGVKENEEGGSTPIFLTEDILDQFTIGGSATHADSSPTKNATPRTNSHLALLAMVDCWARLSIQPFDHLALAATPVFRMWIGVAEYLFRSVSRLDAAINSALYDVTHRSDDLEFVIAARGWSQCVAFGNFELYKDRFTQTATFFESRFEEANKIGGEMIKLVYTSFCDMPSSSIIHPFQHTTGLLVVIPDQIDVEEESRFYDELCDDLDGRASRSSIPRSQGPPSVFSHDIWLGDNSGESRAFARDVQISGWTNVGDRLGGAYVVYDCVIRTKESTTIHAHKRYSAFVELYQALRQSLPPHQQHFVPALPPKSPFSRYRPAFLDHRRRQLQYWLCTVLLHPEIGACRAVRRWVMD